MARAPNSAADSRRGSWLLRAALLLLGVTPMSAEAGRFPDGPENAEVFVRGDANADGDIDLADAVGTLNHLFNNAPAPACVSAADADDSGGLELTDSIFVLGYLFLGTPPPASPHPACGFDLVPDQLVCASSLCPSPLAGDTTGYRVFRNGVGCRDEPCLEYSAVTDGAEIPISDVNFAYLREPDGTPSNLTDEQEMAHLSSVLSGGLVVNGLLQDGPRGPAGEGRTLVALSAFVIMPFRRPDFVISELRATGTVSNHPEGGLRVPLTIGITNIGGADSPTAAVHVTIFDGTVEAGAASTFPIPKGATRTLSTEARFPHQVIPRIARVTAVVDPRDTINERLEENNTSEAIEVRVVSAPVIGGF